MYFHVKQLNLLFFALFMFSALPSALAQCKATEVVIFSGATVKKEVAVCASPSTGEFTKITYRFGSTINPDFEYHVEQNSTNRFYAFKEACNRRAGTDNLWFRNGDTTYVVSDCIGGNCNSRGGILVLKGKKVIGKIKSNDNVLGRFGFTPQGPDYNGSKIITKTSLILEKNIEGVSVCSLYD